MSQQIELSKMLPIPISNTDWKGCANLIVNNYKNIIAQMDIEEKSIKNYISHSEIFVRYIERKGLNFNTLVQFKKYLTSLVNIKTGTKRHKLFIAIRLINELKEYGFIDKIKTVKNFARNTGHLKDGVNAQEIEQIKYYISTIESKSKRLRIKAMFCLLANEGLRTFEVCNLEIEDINLQNGTLYFRGKKRDEKELKYIINDSTIEALKSYIIEFKKRSGFLFTSISNIDQTNKNKHLSERGLRKIFNGFTQRGKFYKGVFQNSGITGRSVHGLRHYFITAIYDNSKDTVLTMKAARLKSLQTVINYKDSSDTKTQFKKLQKVFE